MSISANFTAWCDRFALKSLRNAECVLLAIYAYQWLERFPTKTETTKQA